MEIELSFGAWVRRRRKALDMLQKELASRVGCSVTALQKIERDERRPSRQLAERLAGSLDVPADQRPSFLQVARGERMTERLASLPQAVAPPPEAERSPAPSRRELTLPPTPLVGREAELAKITLLLHDPQCRLLTLTGPGGIGKTRLALAAAAQLHDAFAQGVAFVALAPLVGREQVVTAIADALGCVLYGRSDRADQLIRYLCDKAVLLVLDNFEHLLAEAACAELISNLVRGADGPTLLVTSREPLDIQEEWVFDVQGLPMPVSAGVDDVQASSAARLFQQRARQAQASYTLSVDDNPAVVRICQLVGGVPLGIELAAAWMRTLSCQEIADEIQRNLDFLATRARDVPERHRSIRAVFDQSWSLLSGEEQRVLRRVAVFRGGFTRAAAEEVAGASLALLSALVAKSLLRRTPAGRYDLHEVLHQYALDQLHQDEQEETQTRSRHCQYYAALLEAQGAALKGPDQVAVVAALMIELANVRLAWDWAAGHQLAAKVSQAADTLFWLYEAQSNFREGVPLFGQAVESLQAAVGEAAAMGAEQARCLALGQALSYQGFFCFRQGQHPLSRDLLQRSLALLRPLAERDAREGRAALSTAMAFLGIATYRMGEYAEGRRLLHEGLAIKRELDDRWGAALCLRQLGLATYSLGEYAEAHRLLSESLALSRAMGNLWSLAFSLNFLSRAAYALGAYEEAQQLLQEGLALSQRLADRFNIALAQSGLGRVNLALGNGRKAQGYFEQSIAIWREIGDQDSLAQSLNQLGETLLTLAERSAARECFVEALVVAREAHIAPVMLDALLGVATLRAGEGAVEGALELVIHILENPASTQEARRRAEQLRAALEKQLPPQQLEVIQTRAGGKILSELVAPGHIAGRLVTFTKDEGGRMKAEGTATPLHPSSFIPQPLVEPVGETPLRPGIPLPTGTVTFCFTDIEGSSQLWERHPNGMPAALARHDAIMREAIHVHSGMVFKTVGDSVHAVFARAGDALEAALAAQRALHTEPWGEAGPLRARMALHSGAAEERDGDYFGGVLNRVARILALGHGGQILLSHATHDLVVDDLPDQTSLRDLGEYLLKDLSRSERLFQLVTPDIPADFPPLRALDSQGAQSSRDAAPLLTTKLYIPALRPQLVARPRLIERVQAGLLGKLTLIVAPAGYGKTTLLSAWLHQNDERRAMNDEQVETTPHRSSFTTHHVRVAWVSLDADDNDAIRFWKYVSAALETVYPTAGASVETLLRSPQPPPVEVILTSLINAITPLTTNAALILDDYHVISTPAIHTAMTFLLDHLPAHLHLIIISRADPPLPLTRLRTRGELTELRAADLRFTAEETAAFLTELMGLPLSADDVRALESRTEGWIAGLQLAALAMRDRSDLAGFVRAFSGSNRFVVDYLFEEVLDQLPAHLQMFLLQTSNLDRLCGPLCDAVLGLEASDIKFGDVAPASSLAAYSQIVLEKLERANLFLIPLDDERRWYRYHHLFAEVLRVRLHSGATAGDLATLHQRASAWHERNGFLPEAIQHALAAQDWERAAGLIEACAWPIAFRGQIHTVLRWFNALPTAFIRARPTLATLHALMLMHTNQLGAADARLQEAEQALLPDTPEEQARSAQGLILTTRANISFYRGDLPGCVALGRQALDTLPETPSLPRVAAMVFAAHNFLLTGAVTPAIEQEVAAVAPAARAAGNRFVLLRGLTLLAELRALQGRLRMAATTYREAEQIAPEPGKLQSLIGSASYYFGLGDLYREWNDLVAAEQLLTEAMDRAIGMLTANGVYFGQGFIALARLQHARGDHAGALATLTRFADFGRQCGFDPLVLERGVAMQTQLALAQGSLEAALQWADTSSLRVDDEISFPRQLEYLTLARVLIAQGRGGASGPFLGDALSLLDRLLAAAEAGGRVGSAIEILMLRALALEVRRDTTGALTALERALALAAPEGYVRIFVDEGAPMAALLVQCAERRALSDPIRVYTERLVLAFPEGIETKSLRLGDTVHVSRFKSHSSDLVEPLTERELEILRLIAQGHSNQDIADTLIIAVSTVKRHINNIYGKLDVQSRTQALVRARELQLL